MKEYAEFVRSIDFTDKAPITTGVVHHALSLAGEVGELCGKVVKQYYRRADWPHGEFHYKVIGELGDCLYHLTALCNCFGVPIEDLAAHNMAKLKNRQQKGTLVGEGDDR